MITPPETDFVASKLRTPTTIGSGLRTIFLIVAGVATTACTTPYEGRYDFYDAWRKGKVVEVGTAQELGRSSPQDCRKDATPRAADTRYANVRYRSISRLTSRIVPLGAHSKLKAGDLVYMKVDDCNAPVPSRSAQTDSW